VIREELLEAVEKEHRAEVGKLKLQLVVYRRALVDAGVDPPDMDGDDLLQLWQSYADVARATGDFVVKLGPAKEMLDRWT